MVLSRMKVLTVIIDIYKIYFIFNTFIHIFNTLLFMYVGIYAKIINKFARLIALLV